MFPKGEQNIFSPCSTKWIKDLEPDCCLPLPLHSETPYRGVILHDGVVKLVAFAGPSCQEACLADVHVKLFQTPVPWGDERWLGQRIQRTLVTSPFL